MEKLDMEVEHVFCMAIVDSTRGKLVGVLQAINKVSSHSDKRLRLKLEESKCFQVHDHNNAGPYRPLAIVAGSSPLFCFALLPSASTHTLQAAEASDPGACAARRSR